MLDHGNLTSCPVQCFQQGRERLEGILDGPARAPLVLCLSDAKDQLSLSPGDVLHMIALKGCQIQASLSFLNQPRSACSRVMHVRTFLECTDDEIVQLELHIIMATSQNLPRPGLCCIFAPAS